MIISLYIYTLIWTAVPSLPHYTHNCELKQTPHQSLEAPQITFTNISSLNVECIL